MTLAELRDVARECERLYRWDGDGQPVDHGKHGAFNDRLRAAWRAIYRRWLTMDADTARKMVRALEEGTA